MSGNPVINIMRSINFTHIVNDFASNITSTYEDMKIPRMEKRMEQVNTSFDNQIKVAQSVNEFAKADKIKELSEKMKEIRDFSAVRYSGRLFKQENLVPRPSDEPMIEIEQNN